MSQAPATIGDSEFDRATAVDDDGRGEIHDGWDIGGNANGGYLAAIAARGLARIAGRQHPITLTAHFLAPGRPGPVRVSGTVVKHGRQFTTVAGTLSADDRPILQLLGAFGDLDGDDTAETVMRGAPPPGPFEARRAEGVTTFVPALAQRLETAFGEVADGRVTGTFAFADGRPADPFSLLLTADAFMPAVFTLGLPSGWVPTVEYTVHLRGLPSPGPLRCAMQTRFVSGGRLEEDGEVWDSAGRLVALSRQLGLAPRG